jgi:hypothetical protein
MTLREPLDIEPSVVIGQPDACLKLFCLADQLPDVPPRYLAILASPSFTSLACVGIESWEDPASLPDFFSALAKMWRGWDGERHWNSGDNALSLVCTHDGVRAVNVAATLRWLDWSASGYVSVEVGSLDTIAANLARLVSQVTGFPGHESVPGQIS